MQPVRAVALSAARTICLPSQTSLLDRLKWAKISAMEWRCCGTLLLKLAEQCMPPEALRADLRRIMAQAAVGQPMTQAHLDELTQELYDVMTHPPRDPCAARPS